jgi:hypothetical protein
MTKKSLEFGIGLLACLPQAGIWDFSAAIGYKLGDVTKDD